MSKPRAIVYIDGFNLYYSALKNTPYRWLNVQAALQDLFPEYDVTMVRYFTARVSDHKQNGANLRQQVYLRALQTIPNLEVTYGNFIETYPRMPLYPRSVPVQVVRVVKTEEKGSDVNIATHMLCDCYDGLYDVAILVSNDSDLTLPVRLLREKLGRTVYIVTRGESVSRSLKNAAHNHRELRKHYLKRHQFPLQLSDAQGIFTCPTEWQKGMP